MTRINGHAPKRRRHQQPHDRICPWCYGAGRLQQPWPHEYRTVLCWCCQGDGWLTAALQPRT